MRSELREESLRVLGELANGNWRVAVRTMGMSEVTLEALDLLESNLAIWAKGNRYIVTTKGYDYQQELKAPFVYWAKKNWFPVAVLVVSSLVTLGSTLIVVRWGPS